MYDNDSMTQRETELMAQLATAQARMTPIVEALESLCHAVERGETDDDYLRGLAEDGRRAIATPKGVMS